jgi:hypothetical protein
MSPGRSEQRATMVIRMNGRELTRLRLVTDRPTCGIPAMAFIKHLLGILSDN